MEHGHTIDEIRKRINAGSRQNFIGDFIYGGIDGTVTTFAIVAGVEGAGFSQSVIIALGIANILADGFSMAASNYSGTKAERDNEDRLREIEARHIAEVPEGERDEVREILSLKGLSGAALEQSLEVITANHDAWIDYMLAEEYGISSTRKSAFGSGLVTFIAFLICGMIPLLPFFTSSPDAFVYSAIATGITFFAIGAAKSFWSLIPWWRSALETFAIGSIAAAIAYFAGHFVSQF